MELRGFCSLTLLGVFQVIYFVTYRIESWLMMSLNRETSSNALHVEGLIVIYGAYCISNAAY